jgi:SEL1 protein
MDLKIRKLIQGDSIAQYGMGMLYLLGAGDVPKDQGKALQYFKASAEQNYSPAQVAIAKMYLEQNEIIIATRYFELAARQGHAEAFYYLAELSHKGIGREKHCGTAAAYYKIVAERVEVLHSTLGEALTAWNEGRFTDAMVGYMMAAEQGYECGQVNVAYLIDQCTLPDMKIANSSTIKRSPIYFEILE